MKIVKPSIELLWITENPLQAIEIAGRTCYKSEDKITPESAAGFVRGLRKSGHHAMLEHASASFRVVTDRGVTHEIVRHRIASYAQESTRYCNYSKDKFGSECSFIEPPNLSKNRESGKQFSEYSTWVGACLYAEAMYFQMLGCGCSPQIARSVLPNCLKTEIVCTYNLREWRHFISLRGAPDAHPQIRPIAWSIWEVLMTHASAMFEDFVPSTTERVAIL